VDFASVAVAFGCGAYRVERAGEFAPALSAPFAADRPAVIEVMSDPMVAAPPSWAPALPEPTYAGAV
jgi:thiamine pyrophosphate-dependent acetolactate synthase large subunit-like protein